MWEIAGHHIFNLKQYDKRISRDLWFKILD